MLTSQLWTTNSYISFFSVIKSQLIVRMIPPVFDPPQQNDSPQVSIHCLHDTTQYKCCYDRRLSEVGKETRDGGGESVSTGVL